MAEAETKPMTVDEFFEWQKLQDKNYELVDGVPVLTVKAMTGASRRHDYVTVNTITSLHSSLRGKPCRPSTDDQSVRTIRGTRRPDILVECGEYDGDTLEATDPRVVIEVLSPSTMRIDRFQKLEEYKADPRIRVILIVDTQKPEVAVWRRNDSEWNWEEFSSLDAVIPLPEIDTELPLADVFDGVPFENI